MNSQKGFTLIELIVVVAIIAALSGMAIISFRDYRAKASYAIAESTLGDARIALEAALSEPDAFFPFTLNYVAQTSPGPLTDPDAYVLFPGFWLSNLTKITVYHDPACVSGACLSKFIEAKHCTGQEYVSWSRFGDGVEIKLDHVAGAGC